MGSWGRRVSARKLRARASSHQLGRGDLLRLFYAVLPADRPAWVDDRISLASDPAALCGVIAECLNRLGVQPVRLVAAWKKQLGGEPPTLASLTVVDPRLSIGLPALGALVSAAVVVAVVYQQRPEHPTLRLDPLVRADLVPALAAPALAELRAGLRSDQPLTVEAPSTAPTSSELEARCVAEPLGRLGAERTVQVERFAWGQRLTCQARMRHRARSTPVELPALAVLRPLPTPELSTAQGGGCTAALPPAAQWRTEEPPTVHWQWRRLGEGKTAWQDLASTQLASPTQTRTPPLPGRWQCRAAFVDRFTVHENDLPETIFSAPIRIERPLRVWVGVQPRLRFGSPPPACTAAVLPDCDPAQTTGDHPLQDALRGCAAALPHPLPLTFVDEPSRADVTVTATIFGRRSGSYFELSRLGALVEHRGSEDARSCAVLRDPTVEVATFDPQRGTIDRETHSKSRAAITRAAFGAQLPRLVVGLAPRAPLKARP